MSTLPLIYCEKFDGLFILKIDRVDTGFVLTIGFKNNNMKKQFTCFMKQFLRRFSLMPSL